MVFITLSRFLLSIFLADLSKIILVHTFFTKFYFLHSNLTPFCQTSITVTKNLGTSRCVLTQCKVSFDVYKFQRKPEFELLQDKGGDIPSTIRCPLTIDILRNLFLGQRRMWFNKFCFLSVLSGYFLIMHYKK